MKLQDLANRFAAFVASLFLYLPIIAGILTPMVWMLPAFYFAWNIVGWIFPFSEIWSGLWLPLFEGWPEYAIAGIQVIQLIIFLIGLGIFSYGLKTMVTNRTKDPELVTVEAYRRVRHPQHLGLIILLLPPALLQPILDSFYLVGIRPGDILSWSLVAFILLVVADFEESRLLTRFGSEYENYCMATSFIVPIGFLVFLGRRISRYPQGNPRRYIIWFIIYWCLVSTLLFLFTFAELHWTL